MDWQVSSRSRKSFDPPIVTSRIGSGISSSAALISFHCMLVAKKHNSISFEKNVAQVDDRQLNLSEAALKYLDSVGQSEDAAYSLPSLGGDFLPLNTP